jgi:hypothetical protein
MAPDGSFGELAGRCDCFFSPRSEKARISSVHPEVRAFSTTPLRVVAANLFYEHRRPPLEREKITSDGAARSILRLYYLSQTKSILIH